MATLLKYRKNIYSQNGEDGVISEILLRLGIENGWFVEFGAWDGRHLSNAFALVNKGWKGIEIECDQKKYNDLLATANSFPGQLIPLCALVSESGINSLDSLLAGTPLPKEFELLSIDVDSFDWQIWNGFNNYSPKIVVIEINSSYPPGVEIIHSQTAYIPGSSFSATLKLGEQKGYKLVCHTGNMIFIRSDLVHLLHLPEKELTDPQSLFIDNWVKSNSIIGHIKRLVRFAGEFIRK